MAKLKNVARQSGFIKKCPCDPGQDVDYSEEAVLHQLLVGMYDEETQCNLLTKPSLTLAVAEKTIYDVEAAKLSQDTPK